MRTVPARIPAVDMKEARKIAEEMNISVTAALQIYYRKKFSGVKWEPF